MAKKNQKYRTPNKKFPWLLVVLGGGLLLLATVLFANRDRGTPSISVDQQRIDYGDVRFDELKSFAITVTNTGDGPLRFKEQPYLEVVEGC
jgi:hypothetical protein